MLNQIKKFLHRKKWYLEKKFTNLEKKYKKINKVLPLNKIKTIVFDTTNYHTEMCEISIKLNTDKSPYNKSGHYGHRHAYRYLSLSV